MPEEGHTTAWRAQGSVAGGHQARPVRRGVRGYVEQPGPSFWGACQERRGGPYVGHTQ